MGAVWSFVEYVFGIDSKSYKMKERTFAESNFLQIYDTTPKQQSIESVLKGLRKLANKSFAATFAKLAKEGFKLNQIDGNNDEDVKEQGIITKVNSSII